MPNAIPLSPAAAHLWRYLTAHPGEWVEANALARPEGPSYRTVARLLKAFVAVGLAESRPTFPAWTYRHVKTMRQQAPEIATSLDGLVP
jgi:hypothetical protein